MAGSVLSDFRTHLQYVILFHLASFWKQSGKCVSLCVCIYIMLLLLFPSLSCVLGVFGYFFSSFISLEVVQNTFGEVNETICNLLLCCFVFCFFWGGEVIQSHLKAMETLKGCGLGP